MKTLRTGSGLPYSLQKISIHIVTISFTVSQDSSLSVPNPTDPEENFNTISLQRERTEQENYQPQYQKPHPNFPINISFLVNYIDII